MAYIFRAEDLPKLISVTPGGERTFFVDKELANTSDMLAGIMRYQPGGMASAEQAGSNEAERFCFILEGNGAIETEQGPHPVGPGTLVFGAAGDKLAEVRATDSPLVYFEFQAPNQADASADSQWKRVDGKVVVRS